MGREQRERDQRDKEIGQRDTTLSLFVLIEYIKSPTFCPDKERSFKPFMWSDRANQSRERKSGKGAKDSQTEKQGKNRGGRTA